ncbi:MAG: hypothetical protein KGI80_06380 [Verrucomicrobiota bacterium]|nr:hypothetical protein [Verrucomicrobiota bacterium]
MDLSPFFAKWIGIYFLISALILLLRKQQLARTVKELFASEGLLAISAELSLLLGLLLAIENPVWEWSWKGLITIIGYLLILKGIMRLAFPRRLQKMASKFMTKWYWPTFIIVLAIGSYLTYCGFAMNLCQ